MFAWCLVGVSGEEVHSNWEPCDNTEYKTLRAKATACPTLAMQYRAGRRKSDEMEEFTSVRQTKQVTFMLTVTVNKVLLEHSHSFICTLCQLSCSKGRAA